MPVWKVALGVTAVLLLLTQLTSARSAGVPYEQTFREQIKADVGVTPASQPVRLTGSGFAPSLAVTIAIEQPDGSRVQFLTTTDSEGNLSFVYQPPLTGGYTGTVIGSNNVRLASANFTSGPYVWTGLDDYAPGQFVEVFGEGYTPGETVNILFHEELETPFHPDLTLTSVADAAGNIHNNDYLLEAHDAGVRYSVTATGQSSAVSAQTTFMDSLATDCFRSAASGPWNALATWESAPTPACT